MIQFLLLFLYNICVKQDLISWRPVWCSTWEPIHCSNFWGWKYYWGVGFEKQCAKKITPLTSTNSEIKFTCQLIQCSNNLNHRCLLMFQLRWVISWCAFLVLLHSPIITSLVSFSPFSFVYLLSLGLPPQWMFMHHHDLFMLKGNLVFSICSNLNSVINTCFQPFHEKELPPKFQL